MSVKTSLVSLQVPDGTVMQAFVAQPSHVNKAYPGLILFQEAFGVNHHIKDLAQRFAAEGYVVIAPELFHRTAPAGFETVYDFSLVGKHYEAITNDGLIADTQACWDWLLQSSLIEGENIACTGYCLGGRVSFIVNSALPFKAAVSYYGGGIAQQLALADRQQGPILFCWGGLDKGITHAQVEQVTEAMNKAAKPFASIVFSYANHAFFCNERPSYHPQAAIESWALTLAFLKERLR